jgi:AraC family cel operon transcriptional repressor
LTIPQFRLNDYLQGDERFLLTRRPLTPGARPPIHRHDFFELFWLDGGSAMHAINGEKDVLESGTVTFIRPDDEHAIRPRGGATHITNIAFWPETIAYLEARHGDVLHGGTFWSRQHQPDAVRLGPLQRRTLNAWTQRLDASGRGQLALDAFLLAVLGLLVHDDPLPQGAGNGPAWLSESCRALSRPDMLRQGVKGFVAVSGLDPAHVARVCKRYTGKTPSQLVTEARMALAARLLADTGEAIVQIAIDVGLDNLSHFYALFKAHYGMTPRAYRLQNRRDVVGF